MKSSLATRSWVEGKLGLPEQPRTSRCPIPAQREQALKATHSSTPFLSPADKSSAWVPSSPTVLLRGLRASEPKTTQDSLRTGFGKFQTPAVTIASGAAETGGFLQANVCRLQTALWGTAGRSAGKWRQLALVYLANDPGRLAGSWEFGIDL